MPVDFVVPYDPKVDTQEELSKKIFYSLFINRLKANKPVNCFIAGGSGEAKSSNAVKLAQIILELNGLDITEYMEQVNIYTPLQYAPKIKALLTDKTLKKVNVAVIHECRDIIRASNWQSFLSQSVSDINQQSRAVKRMVTLLVSQSLKDITKEVRHSLTYYCTTFRPQRQLAQFRMYKLWNDDRDLERPMLRKAKIRGYLVYPNGRYRLYRPDYFSMTRLPKEIQKQMEKADKEAKMAILERKMDKLMVEIKKDFGDESAKIPRMVDFYSQDINRIRDIGRQLKNGNWRLNKEFKEMHDMTPREGKVFEQMLNTKLESMGVIEHEREPEQV